MVGNAVSEEQCGMKTVDLAVDDSCAADNAHVEKEIKLDYCFSCLFLVDLQRTSNVFVIVMAKCSYVIVQIPLPFSWKCLR